MSDTKHSHNAGYEKRDANIRTILIVSVVSVIGIAAMVAALYDFFVVTREAVVYEQTLKPESRDLMELRASEDSILSTYELLDSARGVYRIPIERAMELLAAEAAGTKAGE